MLGLRQLILLNTLVHGQEDIGQSIAKQRLVFFVKHVVPWLDDMKIAQPIRAEVCRALTVLLPLMGDIYGEHWGAILNALAASWGKDHALNQDAVQVDRYVSPTRAYYLTISTRDSQAHADAPTVPYHFCMHH